MSSRVVSSPRSRRSYGSRLPGKRICAVTLLGYVLLCACTPNSQWEDTRGQRRTDEQRKADYGACYEKAGFKPDGTHPPLNEGFAAITKCMSERGWRVVVGAHQEMGGHDGPAANGRAMESGLRRVLRESRVQAG